MLPCSVYQGAACDPKRQVLTDPQSLNSYSYGNDNPIVQSDPNGRSIWEPLFPAGEAIEQGRYFSNLNQYTSMTPEQRSNDSAKMSFESATAIPGLIFFGTTIGTQLMLASVALQGLAL